MGQSKVGMSSFQLCALWQKGTGVQWRETEAGKANPAGGGGEAGEGAAVEAVVEGEDGEVGGAGLLVPERRVELFGRGRDAAPLLLHVPDEDGLEGVLVRAAPAHQRRHFGQPLRCHLPNPSLISTVTHAKSEWERMRVSPRSAGPSGCPATCPAPGD